MTWMSRLWYVMFASVIIILISCLGAENGMNGRDTDRHTPDGAATYFNSYISGC